MFIYSENCSLFDLNYIAGGEAGKKADSGY